MPGLSLCVGIPTYNGAPWLRDTLESILGQQCSDFSVLVCDDRSTDDTLALVRSLHDPRITIVEHSHNVGYGKNLQQLAAVAHGDILMLMGQDDILRQGALQKIKDAFLSSHDIGVVTRPYYWFENDPLLPVRAVQPFDRDRDTVLSITDGKAAVEAIFHSVGQLSGLAYRRSCMDIGFHEDVFPAHVYPFASITKKYKVYFLKDYTVAVRIESSQTRFKPAIYAVSPTETWLRMFDTVYCEPRFSEVKSALRAMFASNAVGLIQLKNYSTFGTLCREIRVLVRTRPANLLSARFWSYVLLTLLVPRFILRRFTDWYKRKVLSKKIQL